MPDSSRHGRAPRTGLDAGKLAGVPQPPAMPAGAEVVEVRLENIWRDNPIFQFRLEPGPVDDLVKSIGQDGQQIPVQLWLAEGGQRLFIIDGHRRVKAADELGLPTVKAIVRDDLDEAHAYRLAWNLNTIRKGLGPLDKANALRLIREREGVALEEAAAYLGLTRSTAGRLVQLLELPDVLRQAVVAEKLTPGHALVLTQHQDEDLEEWICRVKDEELSVRQLQGLLGKAKRGRAPTYLQRRGGGFKLSGFTFAPGKCDPQSRQRMLEALKRAVAILEESI